MVVNYSLKTYHPPDLRCILEMAGDRHILSSAVSEEALIMFDIKSLISQEDNVLNYPGRIKTIKFCKSGD